MKTRKPSIHASPAIRMLFWGVLGLSALAADADWLVTRAGERIETEGGWQVKGRMVVFTRPGGTLSSIRLSEVDLDASREATASAAEAASRPAAPPPPPPRRPARVITTEDVGTSVPGAEDTDLLVERLRQAHRFKDVGLAMSLVDLQDAPEDVRDTFQTRFGLMMDQRIRSIRFVEASAEELEDASQAEIDDVLQDPDVELAGTIEVDFYPDPDQDEGALSFQVGNRLGVYFFVAPRQVQD